MAKAQLQEIRISFANAYTRLAEALDGLNRRGNLNLVIGVVITILAAGLLAYMALRAPVFTATSEILAHYIPRLSTIIFIEVFSFFFLRLYKATLADSKFYQIELIGLATIDIALQAAMKSGEGTVMAAVISQIARGHRNDVEADGASGKHREFDAKGFASILEIVGKLAVESTKSKT